MSALFSLPVLFAILAIGMSVFYGLRACEIFSVPISDRKPSWRFHQFWLNFLGSGVGWVAAWAVLRATVECASVDCALSVSPSAVSLFFLAFIGVTGYLPATIVGAIGGINEFVSKLLALIGGKP
ncbi:hypothetical protein [Sulfuritortus calidifontis]|uniref:hypothetical protein n=1 Tax=Sulfuritortus calidifontis TaxID=1914471 RepID=UPI000F8218BB|nr:hypothetical protein [Sulfuritortus calidifontis]